MEIIAKKPCSFGGKNFFIGDRIPEELVMNCEDHEKRGIISVVREGIPFEMAEAVAQVGEVFFSLPIVKGSETLEIEVSEPQIREAVKTMQMPVKEATAHIKSNVTDDTVLIMLNAFDPRSAVKKEAELKARELAEVEESAGDA